MDIKGLTKSYDEFLEKAEVILEKMSALNKAGKYWFPSLHWHSNLHYNPGSYNEEAQTIGFCWTNSFSGCSDDIEYHDLPLKYFEDGFDLDSELQKISDEKQREHDLNEKKAKEKTKQKKLEEDRKTYEALKKQFEKD